MADKYCWNCGRKTEREHITCPSCGARYDGEGKFREPQALGAGGIGWSNQEKHPSFSAYHDRQRKSFWKWMAVLALIIGVYMFVVPGHHSFDVGKLWSYTVVMFLACVVLFALFNLRMIRSGTIT